MINAGLLGEWPSIQQQIESRFWVFGAASVGAVAGTKNGVDFGVFYSDVESLEGVQRCDPSNWYRYQFSWLRQQKHYRVHAGYV